jgi:cold shock CspA family protein
MAKGEINRLQTEMGFGYIRETGAAEDIFFHSASLVEGVFDRLREGQSVEFDRAPGKSRALNVRVVAK